MSNDTDANTQLQNALQVLTKAVINRNTHAPPAPSSNQPATASVPAVAQVNAPSSGSFLADLTRLLPPFGQDHLRQLDPIIIPQFDHFNQQASSPFGPLMLTSAAYATHRAQMLGLCVQHGIFNCQNGHIMVDLPPSFHASQHFSYMNSSSQSLSIEQIRFSLGTDKLSVGFSNDSADIQNQQRLEFIVSKDMVLIPAVGCLFCPMRVEGVPNRANQEVRFRSTENFENFMTKRRERQIENMH